MSDLLSSLVSSGGALTAFERSLDVIQENVNNANTPGFARQSINMQPLPFQPNDGLAGGVTAGEVQSARDQYADQQVRSQLQTLGFLNQKVTSLTDIQSNFDISGNSGIDAALNQFFQNLSAWSATPSDTGVRQSVLDSAKTLAQAFQSTAAGLGKVAAQTGPQLTDTVNQINTLTAQIQGYNAQRLKLSKPDAGLDAQMHSSLESLSQLVNFDTLQQPDGTITVLMGGQTPLVIGDQQSQLKLDLSGPAARVLDAHGNDVTAQATEGTLGALLQTRNQILPSLIGDASQPGDLNRMAQAVADRVNSLLTAGRISDGPPPQQGQALFTYDTKNATDIAASLSVDPAMQASQLAAIDPGPPYVSNGTASKLAGLASPTSSADEINGSSYVEFYGQMAGRVGSQLSTVQDSLTTQKQVAAQAQSQRDQISGVSLDQEAVQMLEFQRAYQATSQMVTVLDSLTQTTINMMNPGA